MISQYFYAQRNDGVASGITGFSVTVRTDKTQPDAAAVALRQAADNHAVEVALNTAGPPTLVGSAGIPDMQLLLSGGEISAVFYRNASQPPCVVIHDLDFEDNEEQKLDELSAEMQQMGYVRCVPLIGLPG